MDNDVWIVITTALLCVITMLVQDRNFLKGTIREYGKHIEEQRELHKKVNRDLARQIAEGTHEVQKSTNEFGTLEYRIVEKEGE